MIIYAPVTSPMAAHARCTTLRTKIKQIKMYVNIDDAGFIKDLNEFICNISWIIYVMLFARFVKKHWWAYYG